MRLTASILALFLLHSLGFAQRLPQDFDAVVERSLREWQVPGVAIAVVRNDKVILLKGYGVRAAGSPARVDADTLFGVASNTKAFAAASAATLVDEGKISWDDRVTKHLAGFEMFDPYVTRELTVRDLLSQRNGLAPYGGDVMTWGSSYSRGEIVRRIRFVQPLSSFRSTYAYQNGMFITAGELVEAVTGVTWDEYVRSRFFAPLGMHRTSTSFAAVAGDANRATPHIIFDGKVEPMPWRNIDNLGAAAAMNSTARDMAQWIRLQLGAGTLGGRRYFSAESAHEMTTPQTIMPLPREELQALPAASFAAYGLGWTIRDYRGHKLVRHGGWTDGMLTTTAFFPQEQFGIVVLSNVHNRNITTPLLYTIADAMLGQPAFDWSSYFLARVRDAEAAAAKSAAETAAARQTDAEPSHRAASLVGLYRNEVYGDVRVTQESFGALLTIRFLASPTYTASLEHWHYDVYRAKWRERVPESALVSFTFRADGTVNDLTTTLGDFVDPAEYTFTRVE